MSKYDRIFNSIESIKESLSPEEGVAAVAVIAEVVDSSIDEAEAERLIINLWNFEIFKEYSEDEIAEMLEKLLYIAATEGLGALFNTAREVIFGERILDSFSAGVIMLLNEEDLSIPKQKQPFLRKLQEALELNDEQAQKVIQKVIALIEAGDRDREEEEDIDEEITSIESGEGLYESPLGNFTLPIPVDSQQGGRIQSQDRVVGFSDDMGLLLRIDYYLITPEQIDDMKSQGDETYLHDLLINKYLPQAIPANLPNAEVKYTEYFQDSLEKHYYVLVDMPQGSTISKKSNDGHSMRLDAYRGLLSFVNGEYLYIVSSQRSFLDGETRGSIQEEAENIKQRILNFVGTIEFT